METNKITVSLKDLRSAHKIAAGAVDTKSRIPILGHVHVTLGPHGATFTGTDLLTTARAILSGAATDEHDVTAIVPARMLAETLRALPKTGTVEMIVAHGAAVRFVTPAGMVNVNSIPASDLDQWPVIPDMPPMFGTLSAESFASALAYVLPAASSDDPRHSLGAAMFRCKSDGIDLSATDGHRMHRANLDGENFRGYRQVAISLRALRIVENAISATKAGAVAMFATDERNSEHNAAGFAVHGAGPVKAIVSDRPDSSGRRYPDLDSVLRSTMVHTSVSVESAALRSALAALKPIVTRHTLAARILLNGSMTVRVDNPDGRSGMQSVETLAPRVGPSAVSALNIGYLADALRGDGPATIGLRRSPTPRYPVRIDLPGGRFAIVMPMNVSR